MEVWKPLNWKEVARACALLSEALRPGDWTVEGVVIRNRGAHGALKNEWAIKLTNSRKREGASLIFSVQPRRPYFFLGPGVRADAKATHPVFSMVLHKELKGFSFDRAEAVPNERACVLWFRSHRERLGLALFLYPTLPEAFLVRPTEAGLERLAQSRVAKEPAASHLILPDGSKTPEGFEARDFTLDSLARAIEASLQDDGLGARRTVLARELRTRAKSAKQQLDKITKSLERAQAEPDWQGHGLLLSAVLHLGPEALRREPDGAFMFSHPYEDGSPTVRLPGTPGVDAKAQMEVCFKQAKRVARKQAELATQRAQWDEKLAALHGLESQLAEASTVEDVAKLEAQLGLAGKASATRKQTSGWAGKQFLSKDGLAILVGRTREENRELTFKIARGNDVWLHVRGRPGAHVIIAIPPGKSAPLETLLDAATVALYYSDGQEWGRTEVDYTFRKYVKAIKGSVEVSYSSNKTLMLACENERLKRLLAAAVTG